MLKGLTVVVSRGVSLPRRGRGFTLIELLVVIAIIAILAAILFPVFSQVREKARQTQCLNNMKNIGMATQQYAQDYDERFGFHRTPCWEDGWSRLSPNSLDWYEQYDPYLRNLEVFRCPSSNGDLALPFKQGWKASCYPNHSKHTVFRRPNRKVDYGFNETIHNDVRGYTHIATMKEPANLVILADDWWTFLCPWTRDMDGINVRIAYANGNPWDYGIMCSKDQCPTNMTSMLNETQKNNWPRHLGGAILTFADGHAKWFRSMNIRSKHRGGTLAFAWIREDCPYITDDGAPVHNDSSP